MSTTLVAVAQDGNVFGSDVNGRNLGPVHQFSGAKIGYNPQDRFMVSLQRGPASYTLVVVTQDGSVFGSDVNGRNLDPIYQFSGARIGYDPQDRFMVSLGY